MEAAFCQREWDKIAENLHFLQNAKLMNSGWTPIFVAKVCQSFLDEVYDWNLFQSFFKLKMWKPKIFQFKIPSVFFFSFENSNYF